MPAGHPATLLASHQRPLLLITGLATISVLVPFLGWRATWFGRRLSDQQVERYLRDNERPRRIQHALSQISDRIVQGDAAATLWYPEIVALAQHPLAPIRSTTAWIMGQDNRSEQFHKALHGLLRDSELLVRRNAALSLVRFGDPEGRAEILNILQPYRVRATEDGRISLQVQAGQKVGPGTLLARVTAGHGRESEVRAPFPGRIHRTVAQDGGHVAAGAEVVSLEPDADQVWEALRALYFVGRPEDLRDVDRLRDAIADEPSRIRQQAALTAQAIRIRSERKASP